MTPISANTPPEVLAPAGDRTCMRAAIENGADAVYFGLTEHNARARATNFAVDELADVMAELHERGVKGYVTFNTLIFSRELAGAERLLKAMAEAGVDAILVQDLGLARLARAAAPGLALHASTQMTLTSANAIEVAGELGVERIVLARELSLKEIAHLRARTRIPLEVFVHGALCVAYSGQCLTSEALGGRSANRGECAQACRLPYDLVCDGETRDLGPVRYLLSPTDLAAFELVPELVKAGVASLKIEGRLKTPEYVASVTRHYRMAVDLAMRNQPVSFPREEVEEMELTFSRGFSPGWLRGNNHKQLVKGESSKKRGLLIGEVVAATGSSVTVKLSGSIKRGDGVCFGALSGETPDQGGRVYEVFQGNRSLTTPIDRGVVDLTFGSGAIDGRQVKPGMRVWKTDDPDVTRRLRQSFAGALARRQPIEIVADAAIGSPLRLTVRASNGASVTIVSDQPLEEAKRHPLTLEVLREQFGRLGGTPFVLGELNASIVGVPMAPLSVLGRMRHEMVHRLRELVRAPLPRPKPIENALATLRDSIDRPTVSDTKPTLHLLCRNLEQVREALGAGVCHLYADFQDIREYKDATRLTRAAGATIFLATPRIEKPFEAPLYHHLLRHGADGYLARNLGGLTFFAKRGEVVVADFSLNAANELTADFLLNKGALRVTPSYDLDRDQLMELIANGRAEAMEIVVHQHMPMFHMEHCVFCAFLSPGTDRTNCGRPCDHHVVGLRDRVGSEHRLKADVGCRNTLFNAVPQSAAEIVPRLVRQGVRHFRVEALDDRGARLTRMVQLYQSLLAGEIEASVVWRELKATDRVGVTRGPLEVI